MRKPPYETVLQEGKWAIIELSPRNRASSRYDSNAPPWMVHCCWSQIHGFTLWNFVREMTFGMNKDGKTEILDEASQYTCIECDKKVPDHLITIFTLYQ